MRSTTPTNAWLSFSMEPTWEGVGVADEEEEVVRYDYNGNVIPKIEVQYWDFTLYNLTQHNGGMPV